MFYKIPINSVAPMNPKSIKVIQHLNSKQAETCAVYNVNELEWCVKTIANNYV